MMVNESTNIGIPEPDPRSSVGLAVIDSLSGSVLAANDRWAELLNLQLREIPSCNWYTLVIPQLRSGIKEDVRSLHGKKQRFVVRDEVFSISDTGRPLRCVMYPHSFPRQPMSHVTVLYEVDSPDLVSGAVNYLSQPSLCAGILDTMIIMAGYDDPATVHHVRRTSALVRTFIDHLPPVMRKSLSFSEDMICIASMMHDLGKRTLSPSILQKPGPLTPAERKEMQAHTFEGERLIRESFPNCESLSLCALASKMALFHHEKWYGSGYPEGRKGEDIPLVARIVALADVYEALVSERPYKRAVSHEEALDIILSESGSHFDPALLGVFLAASESISAVCA